MLLFGRFATITVVETPLAIMYSLVFKLHEDFLVPKHSANAQSSKQVPYNHP